MNSENSRIFKIEGENYEKLLEFEKKHNESCWGKYHDSLGALFSYTFVPTGLGYVTYVECSCGEKLDISDLNF